MLWSSSSHRLKIWKMRGENEGSKPVSQFLMSNQSQLPLGEEHLLLHGLSSSVPFDLCFKLHSGWLGALSPSTTQPVQHCMAASWEAGDPIAFSPGWSQAYWSCLSVAPCKHGCSGSRSGARSFSVCLGIFAPHLPAQCRHVPGLSSFSSAKHSDKIINLALLAHILYSKLFVSKSIISTKSLYLNHEK